MEASRSQGNKEGHKEVETPVTYAVNAEFDFASIFLIILAIALQGHIGSLALAHGLGPLKGLRAGSAYTVHATLQSKNEESISPLLSRPALALSKLTCRKRRVEALS